MEIATALEARFRSAGEEVSDVVVADAPDIRLTLDRQRKGFECRQIPPARVYKWIQTKFKQLQNRDGHFVRIVWPYEPHWWLREAISEKSKMAQEYLENSDCETVSLVVHSPPYAGQDFISLGSAGVLELLGSTAQEAATPFERIYFWDRHHGLVDLTPDDHHWPTPTFDLSGGYPTRSFALGHGSFTTLKQGEAPIKRDYGEVAPELIQVPSEAPEFSGLGPNFKVHKYRIEVEIGSGFVRPKFEIIE